MVQALDECPDSVREYSQAETETLTAHLAELQRAVNDGRYSHLPFGQRVLSAFHQSIFYDVRGHAGKHRSASFGSESLTFGPHRSCHRRDVEGRLAEVFARVAIDAREVLSDPDHERYDERAITAAVRAHADVVQIHPFEDGNGRTSRMVLDYMLVRFGLSPIPIEAVKQEYYDAMTAYFNKKNIRPLAALYMRIAASG